MMYENTQNQPPRVIETASATTSPDNANSGNSAYLISAVALVVVMFFATSIGGCMSSAFKSFYYLAEDDIVENYWETYNDQQEYFYDYDVMEPRDFDELFGSYEGGRRA